MTKVERIKCQSEKVGKVYWLSLIKFLAPRKLFTMA